MQIPRDGHFDSTLALLREGYGFMERRRQRTRSDLFETRLLLRRFICMRGAAAAAVFYDRERFMRRGAAPIRLQKTLFGVGGVQGMDGEAHRWRKRMFMSLMTPKRIRELAAVADAEWHAAAARWAGKKRVVLLEAAQEVLCRAVCAWSGVPLDAAQTARRTRDLAAIIDGAGGVGLRYGRGKRARTRAERWIGGLIARVRAGTLQPPAASALSVIARHRTPDGALLATRIAAVEVLNVLRPTVAIARYIAFAALALHEHPAYRQRLHADDDAESERFVQEVRRFYPFFPFVAARVQRAFTWRGYRFPKGRRALLDLYGTDHDPRLWEQPDAFLPERFARRETGPFDLIPQGGGDHDFGHRCAGEWVTIALMRGAVRFLTSAITYDVPPQNLTVSPTRFPTAPKSGFVIARVRPVA